MAADPGEALQDIAVETGGYDAVTPWDEPAWRKEALGWVAGQLGPGHARPVRGVRARLRPWSVVLRIPLADGRVVWFKANPPGSAFEPALAQALAAWVPGQVLQPLAVDTARAWSLLPDGGPVGGRDIGAWEAMMRDYAHLQLALAPRAGELLPLGVPDLRPERLPSRLDALLGSVSGLEPGERAALRALQPRFARWCGELAASPVAASLDHADLHDASVLTGTGDARHLFFDWGDSSVAHPFASLLVAARVIRERAGPAAAPAALARLRDAYLAPWAERGPLGLDELRRLASLACRVAAINRADTWNRVFPENRLTPAALDAHVTRWLRELLRDPPLPAPGEG